MNKIKSFLVPFLLFLLFISSVYALFMLPRYRANKIMETEIQKANIKKDNDELSALTKVDLTNSGKVLYSVSDEQPKFYIYDFQTNTSKEFLDSTYKPIYVFKDVNKVLTLKDNIPYLIDLISFEITKLSIYPSLIKTDSYYQSYGSVIPAVDDSKLIIYIDDYDKNSEEYNDAFAGPLSVKSSEYLYNLSTNSIEQSNILRSASILPGMFTEFFWDNKNNLIYRFFTGEGSGCSVPVEVTNLVNGKTVEQTSYGFEMKNEAAHCPSFNKNLTKFVLVPKFDVNKESIFSLYKADDINKPIMSYDLNTSIDLKPETWYPYSITWANNDKKLYLAQTKNIYEINLQAHESRLIFSPAEYIYHNHVLITDDDKYLVVNNVKSDGTKMLIKIDIASGNQSTIYEGKSSIMPMSILK